jgi:hypothetical protein
VRIAVVMPFPISFPPLPTPPQELFSGIANQQKAQGKSQHTAHRTLPLSTTSGRPPLPPSPLPALCSSSAPTALSHPTQRHTLDLAGKGRGGWTGREIKMLIDQVRDSIVVTYQLSLHG